MDENKALKAVITWRRTLHQRLSRLRHRNDVISRQQLDTSTDLRIQTTLSLTWWLRNRKKKSEVCYSWAQHWITVILFNQKTFRQSAGGLLVFSRTLRSVVARRLVLDASFLWFFFINHRLERTEHNNRDHFLHFPSSCCLLRIAAKTSIRPTS